MRACTRASTLGSVPGSASETLQGGPPSLSREDYSIPGVSSLSGFWTLQMGCWRAPPPSGF
eukprot:5026699-Pyramimonas_sp.AAC.1